MGNHFTELVREARRTTGTPDEMLELVLQSLVCQRCEARGGSAPMNCSHSDGDRPSWHRSHKTKLANRIGAANPATVLQEQKNFLGGAVGNVFDARQVARFLTDEGVEVPRSTVQRPALIMMTIDPSTSGDCDTAVALTARYYGSLLLCGLALRCTRGTKSYKQFLTEVDEAISADSWLRDCAVIVYCENNTGLSGGVTEEVLSGSRYYHPVLSGEDPGIRTGTHNKTSYAHSLNSKLESGQMQRLADFLIVHGEEERAFRPDPAAYRAEVANKVAIQHMSCTWRTIVNSRTGINARAGWSGKTNNTEDDGVIVIAISAEADAKWGKRTATKTGFKESYITGTVPNRLVDAWGKTRPLLE